MINYIFGGNVLRVVDGMVPRVDELVSFKDDQNIHRVHMVEYMVDYNIICVYLLHSGLRKQKGMIYEHGTESLRNGDEEKSYRNGSVDSKTQ